MLIFGLVLIGVGALVIVAAVFTAETTGTAAAVEFIGVEVGAVTLFLLGLVAGIAILWGLTITRFGARRSLKQRREQNRLNELSDKLDKVEAERRRDHDDNGHDQGQAHI